MTIFKYKYYDPSDLTKYKICEFIDGIEQREVSESYYLFQDMLHSYTPEKISGNRFIAIVDGVPVVNPDKDVILAAEETVRKKQEKDDAIREELRNTDWKIIRHLEQITLAPKDANLKVKLSDKEFEDLLRHRQSLRDQVSDLTIDVSIGE